MQSSPVAVGPFGDIFVAPNVAHFQLGECLREVLAGRELRHPLTAQTAEQLTDLGRGHDWEVHTRSIGTRLLGVYLLGMYRLGTCLLN